MPGNIGVYVENDGVILIDDQFAPLTPDILAAIAKITDKPIRFLINTHAHPDHVGGNENLGKRGVFIVAHASIRNRLLEGIFGGPPYPEKALPVITFNDELSFHLGDEEVHAIKVTNAHTDGDTVIHFTESDVLHTGDVFRTTTYPFIDTDSGGSFTGQIAVLEQLIDMAGPDTVFIPGHGQLSHVDVVRQFHDMLTTIRDRVQSLIDQGKSLQEVLEADITADYDDRWNIKPGDLAHYGKVPFIKMVYRQLKPQ